MDSLLERTVVKHDKQLEQLTQTVNKSFQEMTAVINRQGNYIAQLMNELNAVKAELQKAQQPKEEVNLPKGWSSNYPGPGFSRN